MKKLLAIILTLSLVLGNLGFVSGLSAPSDVVGTSCEEAVKALSDAGVINGYPDGTFKPKAFITRAEAAKLIVAALGYGKQALSNTSSFSDTKGHWGEKYIGFCAQLGILNGYPDGTFKPDDKISFDEIITMLVKALGYTNLEGTWPDNYLAQAKTLGILGSISTGNSDANRGDVVILLYQTWTKPIGTMVNGKWVANTGNDTMKQRLTGVKPADPVIPSGSGSGSGHHHNGGGVVTPPSDLKGIVSVMKNSIKGESAFDYMSYVYMGWRTTGGPWQNHIINNFVVDKLKDAGYVYSENDQSNLTDKDYVWVQHDDSDELVWAPEYASLTIVEGGNAGLVRQFNEEQSKLIDTVNVESYSFDPTSEIYMDHYNKEYGITSIDDMYQWITKKDDGGIRTNVVNGLEAELNKRAHLARNSCFTDPSGTKVEDAVGVEGEVVYIGEVMTTTAAVVLEPVKKAAEADTTESALTTDSTDAAIDDKATNAAVKTIYYGSETGIDADLEGKVLLSDSKNSKAFMLAKQEGAVAVMTTFELDDYNNPTIGDKTWYTDSARYAAGVRNPADSLAQMKDGKPIVQWNLSLDQRAALMELLKNKETPVQIKSVAIGDIYSMAYDDNGEGQLTAIAEIKGTTKANERVMFMAHVQEPGACDNASGVGLQMELALKLKKMIDSGILKRPERTITFIWGDEMTCSDLWLNAHEGEKAKVVGTIDLDMVGEDPEKTGGPMRIEKTPDPSAFFNYTFDVLPGQDLPTSNKAFIRLPDSHTLWGAGDPPEVPAFYINDLYMAATQEVIQSVDKDFKVAVCPFEGGSDHQVFLEAGIPAVLTWHFTDYVYHTTVDTLDKASAREMQNVGITSLAAGYLAAIAGEHQANEMMAIVYNAAAERFKLEKLNTVNHYQWAKDNDKSAEEELKLELEVLDAWGAWYIEALESCEGYFLGGEGSEVYHKTETDYMQKIRELTDDAKARANEIFAAESAAS